MFFIEESGVATTRDYAVHQQTVECTGCAKLTASDQARMAKEQADAEADTAAAGQATQASWALTLAAAAPGKVPVSFQVGSSLCNVIDACIQHYVNLTGYCQCASKSALTKGCLDNTHVARLKKKKR